MRQPPFLLPPRPRDEEGAAGHTHKRSEKYLYGSHGVLFTVD